MNAYSLYIIVLRITHIVAGALWVGSGTYYFLFVGPTVKELGPAGPQFMQNFIEKRRVPLFMNVVSSLTILAGLLLYWSTSGGLQAAWLRSGPGIGFTLGSVAAIIVYGIGFFMIRPRAERLGAISKTIAVAGGPPTAVQQAELQKLGGEMAKYERVDVALLMVSLVLMATARYWTF
jgi:hypothetical protein